MATHNGTPLQVASSMLEMTQGELNTLLYTEFQTITKDVIDKERYPKKWEDFLVSALERIIAIYEDEKYFNVLKRIIHREEARHFYFYQNELEAVSRILNCIDFVDGDSLTLAELDLYTIPAIIRRVSRLKVLNVSKNRLRNFLPLSTLPNLEVLIADDNEINEIGHLNANKQLRALSLNRNTVKKSYEILKDMHSIKELYLVNSRITTSEARVILQCPFVQKIDLQGNPIDAPLSILTNVAELRSFLNVKLPRQQLEEFNEIVNKTTSSPNQPTSNDINPGIEDNNASFDELLNNASGSAAPNEPASPEPSPQPTEPTQSEVFISYAIREIKLKGNPDKTLLDVEKIASIFYNLIAQSDEKGEHFFGLFGRWGRGKTYFWKHILNNNLNTEKYTPIEFHAWKYQDTPGVWAYLYNTLSTTYIGEKPGFWQWDKWLRRYGKQIKLNYRRGKVLPLLGGIAVSIGFILLAYHGTNNDTFKQFLLVLGVPASVIALFAYVKTNLKIDARKIISSLTANVNFNSQLGFQHEIQQELKHLLKAWIPDKQLLQKRIFLFIDDIDRCSEDKIIQIVDYIRVLLHDEEIQKRITVLAAIDERILLHAIQDKYKHFVESDDNNATYKELCREYMDKLFLAGLKLGPLTEDEKRQVFNGFTEEDTSREEVPTPAATGFDSDKVARKIAEEEANATVEEKATTPALINNTTHTVADTANDQQPTASTPVVSARIPSTAAKQYPYEKWEQAFIKKTLAEYTESTPRSIRVYSYRYLLGKQLVEKALTEGKKSWTQWYNTKEAKQCFALKLLHYGFRSDVDHLLIDYKRFIQKYDENSSIEVDVYGHQMALNQELGSIMYQVLTMIVAY